MAFRRVVNGGDIICNCNVMQIERVISNAFAHLCLRFPSYWKEATLCYRKVSWPLTSGHPVPSGCRVCMFSPISRSMSHPILRYNKRWQLGESPRLCVPVCVQWSQITRRPLQPLVERMLKLLNGGHDRGTFPCCPPEQGANSKPCARYPHHSCSDFARQSSWRLQGARNHCSG